MLTRAKREASPDDFGPQKKRRADRHDMSEPSPHLQVDFRTIPVIPQLQDVQRGRPFLRPNVTNRAYESLHHYLDVQYRLLREDYIRPLRDGIEELRNSASGAQATNGLPNVKVYRDVRLLSVVSDRNGNFDILHKMRFSTQGLENVRWQNNKRLMFGNLLCISSDMFQNEVHFAVVTNRNTEDLENGYITVTFVFEENMDTLQSDSDKDSDEDEPPESSRPSPSEAVCSIDMNKVYVAVESDAYFEAYRHVLAGLKDTQSLPMERYIVGCAKDVRSPQYLRPEDGQRHNYNFSSITREDKPIDPLGQEWPTHEELGLNQSQAAALKLALTNEMAIIQGPPGTGKTHVGIAIMNLLLQNENVWSRIDDVENIASHSPILVVCYTNHALDQFLTEILEFTQSIVRLGGRCQNDLLKRFTLHEIKPPIKGAMNLYKTEKLKDRMRKLARQILPKNTAILQSYWCVRDLNDRYVPPRFQRQFYPPQRWDEEDAPRSKWLRSIELQYWLGLYTKQIKEAPGVEWVIGDELRWLMKRMRLHRGKPNGGTSDKSESKRTDGEAAASARIDKNKNWQEEADIVQQQRILSSDMLEEDEMMGMQGQRSQYARGRYKQNISHGQNGNCMKKCEFALRQLLGETSMMTEKEESLVNFVHDLSIEDRWRLYRTWVNRWRDETLKELYGPIAEYSRLAKEAREIELRGHAAILQGADVVAATTTGAAKYRNLLYNLKCKIVVVEEAAEVMEAHIITAMPRSTQHLILIGDHQQLKPSTTVYELAKRYHLDTSLFERMIKAKVPHVTLNVQHRMRPEIAELLRPRIYRDLEDHESVEHRGEVTGISKPVFFISHDVAEQQLMDGKSKQNAHEVEFIVALCDYILKQGYQSNQITILTMYSGQLFAFRNAMTDNMEGIRVTAVDNFQGEENDFILLSLVRSNEQAKIGFLAIENRICVALSRAKKALYCIGNMELLAKTSRLWKDIKEHLEKAGCIGESLLLRCTNHPGCDTEVREKFDFSMVPEGGCGQPCRTRLTCGHGCPRTCHPVNDHSYVNCKKTCNKMLECGHRCIKICSDSCFPCYEVCGKTLGCGHRCLRKCNEPCHPCKAEVIKNLNCGHEQKVLCEEPLEEVKCQTKFEVKLRCGHLTKIRCMLSGTEEEIICREKCTDHLDCIHECKGSCGECYQGRLHIPCTEPCCKALGCRHRCDSKCSSSPPITLCNEPCYQDPCKEGCDEMPGSGHQCISLLWDPHPKLYRICKKDEVTKVFDNDNQENPRIRFVELEDCGHIFTYEELFTWMNQKQDDKTIKMEVCPRCSIWRSTRYGDFINELFQSIKKTTKSIKWSEIIQQSGHELREIWSSLFSRYNNPAKLVKLELEGMLQLFRSKRLRIVEEIYITKRMLKRLKTLRELERAEAKLSIGSLVPQNYKTAFRRDIRAIHKWIMLKRHRITEKEDQRFRDEIKRLKRVLEYFIMRDYSENQPQIDSKVGEMVDKLGKLLLETFTPYNDDFTVKRDVDRLFERIVAPIFKSGFGICTEENKMICSTMEFQSGRDGFECPNGHVFATSECGEAIEILKCPECYADIGGTS